MDMQESNLTLIVNLTVIELKWKCVSMNEYSILPPTIGTIRSIERRARHSIEGFQITGKPEPQPLPTFKI